MQARYFSRTALQARLGRRRLLAGSGVLGGGLFAWAAAGCSSTNNTNNGKAAPGTVASATSAGGSATAAPAAPAAATAATGSPAAATPKRGGVYKASAASYPTTFDPHLSGASAIRTVSYSRLFCEATGPGLSAVQRVPDAAASHELSPDGLTLTVKLKPNVKFQGQVTRLATADDVVFSYDRYRGKVAGTPASPESGQVVTPNIDTITAVDKQTVQFKLKQVVGPYLTLLSGPYTAYIMPVESGTAFDPAKQVNGSGGWLLDSFTPGSLLRFKRNPEWHFGPDRPYLDTEEAYVIPEAATRETQFLGGNVDNYTYVPGSEVQRLKDSVKGVQLDAGLLGDPVPLSGLAFSGNQPGAPWLDVRVRQAISMALDRDAMTEAAYDIQKLQSLGVPAKLVWNNFIQASFQDYWLDPKGNKIDPNAAKLFKYDPQAAKQLLSAAGYPNGFKAEYHYTDNWGPGWHAIAELTPQYLSKIGIDLATSVDDYQAVYVAHTRQGEFNGIALVPFGSFYDPGDALISMYPKGANRNLSKVDDPALTDRITKIQALTNEDQRKAQILDVQNELTMKMYYVPMQAGAGPVVTAYQPYLQNAIAYDTVGGSYSDTYYWTTKS